MTIAQDIRKSTNPYQSAIGQFVYRDVIHTIDGEADQKIFYFEDESYLVFEVIYMPVEDGTR